MWNISFLVLLFVIKLKFKTYNSINIIYEKYGREALKNYRLLEKEHFRKAKLKLDIDFLQKCINFEKVPKFLQFKIYNGNFRRSRKYREWQNYLLNREIRLQKKKLSNSSHLVDQLSTRFKNNVTFLDFYVFKIKIFIRTKINCEKVKKTHEKKLKDLDISPPNFNYNSIFNYSDRTLSDDERNVLALGLDFCIPFYNVDFLKHFLSFERIVKTLEKFNSDNLKSSRFSIENIFDSIKQIGSECFNSAKRLKDYNQNPVFNKSDIATLNNLGKDPNIVITRPDKGKGVVVLNKNEYLNKTYEILNDRTTFKKVSGDLLPLLTKLEDKLNRILKTVKDNIGWKNYNFLYAAGSQPGIMYCLPKVHKPNIPLRPIISSINTASYNLAKFLVPYLTSISTSPYTLTDTESFIKYLQSLSLPNNCIMASFDIKSLFTNVPLKETTNIILSKYSPNSFYNISSNTMQKLLNFTTTESIFLFNGDIYNQIDGVAMGTPIGPTYANIFMSHHESIWLDNCPPSFKPLAYRRYVDDTFLIFHSENQVHQFLNYLNNKHPKIQFTCEIEENGELPFLDVNVLRSPTGIQFSVYRKTHLPDWDLAGSAFVHLFTNITQSKHYLIEPLTYPPHI